MHRHNELGFAHTFLFGFIILVLLAISGIGYVVYNRKDTSKSIVPTTLNKQVTVDVLSTPADVTILGTQECRAVIIAPYRCKLSIATKKHATFTAPADAQLNGKKLTFTTWDGCSASSQDKKICEVDLSKAATKQITARYSQDSATTTTPVSTPIKPPVSDCSNASDGSGIVTCTTSVFNAPFGYLFQVILPADDHNSTYYPAPVAPDPYITCNTTSVCTPVNSSFKNQIPAIVSGVMQPGQLYMKLFDKAIADNGKQLQFDRWDVTYDPNRYPVSDPSQHTVYFVTAYYKYAQ